MSVRKLILVLLLSLGNLDAALSISYYSPQLINHVLLVNDKLFIGSVNNLSLLLASTLSLQHSITTGPVKDSPLCSHDGSSCLRDANPKLIETHAKLLHLNKAGLLFCGSTRLGTCSIYSADDLSLIQSGDIPVVANSALASTIWLGMEDDLVVAASPTEESPYRDPFPAVAVRSFPELFVTNSGSLEGEAAVYLREEFRSLVRYIKTFHHGHFVFVLSVQGKRPVTKLIRFCANDTRFVSYSEIELQCRGEDNTNYPEVTEAAIEGDRLIASFTDPISRRSSICSFQMTRLQLTFWYNIDRCRGGSDSIGLPHIGRDKKCTNKSRMPLAEDTCEMGVGGTIEAVQVASWESRGTVTALAAVRGVLVVGMDDGSIVKLKWRDQQQLEKYAEVRLPAAGNEAIRGIILDSMKMLVFTGHEIHWLPLADCSSSSSCSSCLLTEDPLCQWCHSTSTCQTASSCPTGPVEICPAGDGPPQPDSLPVGSTNSVFLPVKHLPQPDRYKYECVFGHAISEATWSEDGVRCAGPKISLTGGREVHLLKLRTSLSPHAIIVTNYSFYDCQQMTTCGECVSMSGCDWCSSSSCNAKGSCPGEVAQECARIITNSLIFPVDISRNLELSMEKAEKLSRTGIKCRLDQKIVVDASLLKGKVTCLAVKAKKIGNQSLEIMQNDKIVDITQVTVYDCSLLAGDCSSCAVLDPKWSCGWCSGRCSSSCSAHSISECDRPYIASFSPSSGPIEGGTVVNITGRDLGSSIEDIRDRVWVGGSKCTVIGYEISRSIRCIVEKGTSAGPVKVAVGRASKRTAESRELFSFVDIGLINVYPLFAPVSGGTKLTLYGHNLNTGSNVTIRIGSVPCIVVQRNSSSSLSCVVGSAKSPGTVSSLEMIIDSSSVKMTTSFEFRPDPTVISIKPEKIWRSGGKPLIVEGKNFDSVLSPRIYLLSSSSTSAEVISEASICQFVNSTVLHCLSPGIIHSDRTALKYSRYSVGFSMDAAGSLRNLGPRIQLAVHPDPQLTPFHGTKIHQPGQSLILDGFYLNEAAEPADYRIFIGKERCYVTIVDSRQLVCTPPASQPAATDEQGSPVMDAPLVTVTIGRVRMELGLLEYATPLQTTQIWALVLALLLAFVAVVLCFFCLWKRKKTEKERDYRKIQLQLEELESNVRKECKQAFAELHTSLSFNPDENDGAEVNSLKEFVGRLLWMEGGPSPSPSLYATSLPLTLAQFDSLLSSRQFIFALVEAADSDPSVSPQEKSLLCSLLTSALLRNFNYLSSIISDLLRGHIAKTVHNGNAGLLFRCSESLVEKLVGKWLAIAMHPFLVENQAQPLLQLYKALKLQVERGPVDEVTGRARYTINESMLLREAVDSVPMDLLVMDLKGRGPFMLKVQSCDSMGQVKAKTLDVVFKGVPFSHRPGVGTFELEWHCPRRGPLSLIEADPSSRRLNTLERFNVPPGALLLMTSGTEHRNSAGDSGQCSWSSLERAPSTPPPGFFHLSTPSQTIEKKRRIDDTIPKNIPEVYLTRLLTSKTTVQKFIDDLLEAAIYMEESSYPPPLKYIFDLLDEEAARNAVDSSISHQWKSNLFALRLWAAILNKPRLLFDLAPQATIDADLTVIAQTLVDCFSNSEQIGGPGISSSRLLFAKEVGRLKPLAMDFLKRVARQPKISEQVLADQLGYLANELSAGSSTAALAELLSWVRGNGLRLAEVLSSDPGCTAARLPQRLSQIVALDSPENIYSTISEYAA